MKDASINFRVDKKLKDTLTGLAEQDNRNLTNYIITILKGVALSNGISNDKETK